MSDAYLGEIQAFGFGYAPIGWLPCDGRMVPLTQYTALYSLIGNYYGGNGTTQFALPNFIGNVAQGQGQGPGLPSYNAGQAVGSNSVTLDTTQIPSHTHTLQMGTATANTTTAPSGTSNTVINPNFSGFAAPPPNTMLSSNAMWPAGTSQGHPNNQPTLAMIYCICVNGEFPTFGMS